MAGNVIETKDTEFCKVQGTQVTVQSLYMLVVKSLNLFDFTLEHFVSISGLTDLLIDSNQLTPLCECAHGQL